MIRSPKKSFVIFLLLSIIFCGSVTRDMYAMSFWGVVKKTTVVVGVLGVGILSFRVGALLHQEYIKIPIFNEKENENHKAPDYVQQQALRYATEMCSPGNWYDMFFLGYIKKYGYLIVYDGPAKKDGDDYFSSEDAKAYTAPRGGIYFPKNSFDDTNKELTPEQEYTLCHEVAHIMNGDMTRLFERQCSETWFKHEYLAENRSIKTLYRLKKDYKVRLCSRESPLSGPYLYGAEDAILELGAIYCGDEDLQDLYKQIKKVYPDYNESVSWQSRYQEYKEKYIPKEFW
jgi:hypothetical protein